MTIATWLLGSRSFATLDKIKEAVQTTRGFEPDKEDIAAAKALLIFSTSKQQTWLVATRKRLYVVLDDLQSEQPVVWWQLDIEITEEGIPVLRTKDKNIVEIRAKEDPTGNREIGIIDIGTPTPWFYSKTLCAPTPIEDSIKQLILEAAK